MKRLIFAILGILIFCGLSAQEIPQKISYQGKLLENGIPVNETKSITFTIGTWSETKSVPVNDGLYSVTLGETTPIPTSIFDNSSSVSLEITVAGTTLSPQTDIVSSPYAFKSEKSVDAEKLNGEQSSYYTNWNNLNNIPADIADGDDINDADANPSNEIQTLSINGSDLSISDGNTVPLPGLTLPFDATVSSNQKQFYILSYQTSQKLMHLDANDGSYGSTVLLVENNGVGGRAAEFWNYNSNSTSHTVKIKNDGSDYALYVDGDKGVEINGDVDINGNLSKSSGTFKIDHPLDPENKYLYHSFVESPDMMNVYNGNIVLDNNGEAIVELPDWFDVLNKDFRYQLTCIGRFAPVFISEKISGNSFEIAGGTSGMEVSWQITGIRQDPYANQNRIKVEVEKSEKEKGHYLHYKEYNQPIEKSVRAVRHPEVLEKLNK